MKSDIVKLIQIQFKELTNSKITKKEVGKFILPLIDYINNNNNNKFIFSGSQGSGKSTLLKIINKILFIKYNKKVLTLNLDNFYFNKNKRKTLSKEIHPLLSIRGVPGTHNIKKLLNVIENFEKSKYPIKIPIFDKLFDDNKKEIKIIKKKCDILILDGWLLGCPPLSKKYLFRNINYLERKKDSNKVWRNFYNNQLKNSYFQLFKKFESTIFLKAPSFSHVLKWRIKQERFLKKNEIIFHRKGMDLKEIKIFVQHYEKITKWMFTKMPLRSDIILYLNKKHKISKIKINK